MINCDPQPIFVDKGKMSKKPPETPLHLLFCFQKKLFKRSYWTMRFCFWSPAWLRLCLSDGLVVHHWAILYRPSSPHRQMSGITLSGNCHSQRKWTKDRFLDTGYLQYWALTWDSLLKIQPLFIIPGKLRLWTLLTREKLTKRGIAKSGFLPCQINKWFDIMIILIEAQNKFLVLLHGLAQQTYRSSKIN